MNVSDASSQWLGRLGPGALSLALLLIAGACRDSAPAPPDFAPAPSSEPSVPSHPPTIDLLDTLWTIGVYDGPPHEVFGRIADVAMDPWGNVYVLDAAARQVRMFDSRGEFQAALGSRGRGPGSFSSPRALRHDGEAQLYVLDRRNGLSILRATGSGVSHVRTIALPFQATDFCFLGDEIYLYAPDEGRLIHRLGPGLELRGSFGTLFGGPDGHPAQYAFSGNGLLACAEDHDVVLAVSTRTGEMHAYRASQGEKLWADSIRGFQGTWIQALGDDGYAMAGRPGGQDRIVTAVPLGEDFALVQSRREPVDESGELVTSCVVHFTSGPCVSMGTSLAAVVSATDSLALTVTWELVPTVTMSRISVARAPPPG